MLAAETYVLLVSNFTASQNGYSLNFAGTASIVDDIAAVPDSISLSNVCNPSQVSLFFSEDFDCSSISGTAEISVSGPSNVIVTQVVGIGCNDGLTNRLRIRFQNKIMVSGTYTISINQGTDGNSFVDGCGNNTPVGYTFTFDVTNIGPDINLLTVSNSNCGNTDGSVEIEVVNGTSPYSYSWNTSPQQNTSTASGLGPGVYRIRVTDANGCQERLDVEILNDSPLDFSNYTVSSVSCNGAQDGTAELIPAGGQGPYTIDWNSSPGQTGQVANNLPGGDILVTVTDNTGCEEEVELVIPEPSAVTAPTTIVNPNCGVANGTATINASGGAGGYGYEWNSNPAQYTATATGLDAGVYDFTVTDSNGCTATGSVILTNNSAPDASIESSVPDCGQGSGQATAAATAGVAPYTYQWSTSPPQNTATATGLVEGDYFVTITDAAGCVQIINVKIDTISPPSIAITPTQPSCGMADGEIEALTTNGVEPFTYSWSSSVNTTNVETGLPEGTYTVTVTDSIGCTDTETINLVQQPPVSEIDVNSVCFGEEMNFSFTTTSGATAWEWDFGDGTTSTDANPTHTYSTAGDFDVSLSLTGGCLPDNVSDTATVFEPPTAAFTIDPQIPTTRDNIAFIYNGNGGNLFSWDLGDGTSSTESRPTHQYPEDGTFDVFLTVVDANGCEDTITQTIEVLLEPVVYLPNAFIPEGTLENSRFRGYGIGVVSAELSVFDRWGTMVFYSNDIGEIQTTGWDGTFNGKPAKQGAYAYSSNPAFTMAASSRNWDL